MKFMKIGTRPDTFYTEEAVRSVMSEIPSDVSIEINNISYGLHKLAVLGRCGLLQRLCCSEEKEARMELHDIPGGSEAFELCAKFCYGITIHLSAHNIVGALCAAKFLRMTESVEKGNFVMKLEAFFNSCILDGWKDSIVALQSTLKLPEWSENLGIIRKCIDSIVEKILTPPPKVTWSYTYTRPGYKKKQNSVPKDWWTEDIAELDTDMFRCVVTALRTLDILPPQLIGEALHVYASRHLILPDPTKHSNGRRTLEAVVAMIPADRGAVSAGFLLRLLGAAAPLGVSAATKTELLRKCGAQLEDAAVDDLHLYDIDLVVAVVESFLVMCRRQNTADTTHIVRSLRKVGRLVDSYLQLAARDVNMPVIKLVALAEAVPDAARETHDHIYKAINIFLKEHPDVNKADKKRLCRILDCQKLSPDVRAHAVKNERLPLRTVVQLLFFEQERGNSAASTTTTINNHMSKLALTPTSTSASQAGKLKLGSDESSAGSERKAVRGEIEEAEPPKLDVTRMTRKGSKGRDR